MAIEQLSKQKLMTIFIFFCVTIMTITQAQSESGVEVEGPNGIRCVPFKAFFSPRLVRSSIENGKKLRMLRGDASFSKIEHLMRAHHNCLLKTDRIRFKKSGSIGLTNSENRLHTEPIEAVLVETRPIRILKQNFAKSSSNHDQTKQQQQSLQNSAFLSQQFQSEPIELEMINDSEMINVPHNDWFEAFDINSNDETK